MSSIGGFPTLIIYIIYIANTATADECHQINSRMSAKDVLFDMISLSPHILMLPQISGDIA